MAVNASRLCFVGGDNTSDPRLVPGDIIELRDGMSIGSRDASVLLTNSLVAFRHAEVHGSPNDFHIRPVAVGAPVFVDGVALAPGVSAQLLAGTLIRLGEAVFVATSADGSVARTRPSLPAELLIRSRYLRESHIAMRDRLLDCLLRDSPSVVRVSVEAFGEDPDVVARSALQAIAAGAPNHLTDVSLGVFTLAPGELDIERRWLTRRFPHLDGSSLFRQPRSPTVTLLEADGWQGRARGDCVALVDNLWFATNGAREYDPQALPETEAAPSQFGFRSRSHGRWALTTPSGGTFRVNDINVPDFFVKLASGDVISTTGLTFRFDV